MSGRWITLPDKDRANAWGKGIRRPKLRHSPTERRINDVLEWPGLYHITCKCGWKSEPTYLVGTRKQFYEHVARVGGKFSRRKESR
jgi:hypothetical protein